MVSKLERAFTRRLTVWGLTLCIAGFPYHAGAETGWGFGSWWLGKSSPQQDGSQASNDAQTPEKTQAYSFYGAPNAGKAQTVPIAPGYDEPKTDDRMALIAQAEEEKHAAALKNFQKENEMKYAALIKQAEARQAYADKNGLKKDAALSPQPPAQIAKPVIAEQASGRPSAPSIYIDSKSPNKKPVGVYTKY